MENKSQDINPWQKEEADKLKQLFDEKKPMSQAAFGEEFDVGTQGMVSQYLLGRRPLNLSAAKKFAVGLGVSISEFSPRLAKEAEGAAALSGDAHPLVMHHHPKTRPGYHRFEVLDVCPSAGPGGEPIDYPVVNDYIEVATEWARQNLGKDLSSFRVLPVSGDSMSPTINDGDLVFVDTSITSFEREGIYVLIWNERLLIKRLKADFSTNKIEIRSDNIGVYGNHLIDAKDLKSLHICGLVRQWWSLRKC